MEKLYSIIIPHKDIPQLLQRCLASIPVREDVQVIVVDDNSSPEVVDFAHFPGQERSDVEVYFTKEGRGPGYARNVALDHAVGKWVMFVDADDLVAGDCWQLLDEMRDAEEDVVYFDIKAVWSDNLDTPSNRGNYLNYYVREYLNGNLTEWDIRYRHGVPWGKLIKKELIDRHHIRFPEIKWGEDTYFAGQVGFYAKKIKVSKTIGYVNTQRGGSVTSTFLRSGEEMSMRYGELLKVERLFEQAGFALGDKRSVSLLSNIYVKYGFRRCVGIGIQCRHDQEFANALLRYTIRRQWKSTLSKVCRRTVE